VKKNFSLRSLLFLTILAVGCGAPENPRSKPTGDAIPSNKRSSPSLTVDLSDSQSVRQFFEADQSLTFQESSFGFNSASDSYEVKIRTLGSNGSVNEVQIVYLTMTDDSVEELLSLTHRLLEAAGESPSDIEQKLERGKSAFQPSNDDSVELRFENDTYVRLAVWMKGSTEQPGVVISIN